MRLQETKKSQALALAIAVGGPTEAVIHCISGKSDTRSTAAPGTVWTCPAGRR